MWLNVLNFWGSNAGVFFQEWVNFCRGVLPLSTQMETAVNGKWESGVEVYFATLDYG